MAKRLGGIAVWVAMVALSLSVEVRPAWAADKKADAKKPAADAAKDKSQWKDLFDGKSLKNWKVSNLGGEGKVYVKDGEIVLQRGDMMTSIAYGPGDFPKINYEVSLEGKRTDGGDFFCTTTFPVGDSFCSFVVGGWGGTVVGLSSINYMDASENETSKFKEFKDKQWYRVRIRVSATRIEAWIDDEQFVDLSTKEKKITIRLECDECKPLGIATWCTTGVVRNIRVRPLTETEIRVAAEKKSDE